MSRARYLLGRLGTTTEKCTIRSFYMCFFCPFLLAHKTAGAIWTAEGRPQGEGQDALNQERAKEGHPGTSQPCGFPRLNL